MSYTNSLTVPRIHQFAIGEQVGSADTLVGVIERINAPLRDTISGLLVNAGLSSFTFSLRTGKASTGSVSFLDQPADGNTVVMDDGPNAAVTFEFDNNASVTESNTLRRVVIGATLAQTIGNLLAAINAAPVLDITAYAPVRGGNHTGSLRLRNDFPGTAGNVTVTAVGANIVVAGMTGGTGAVKNIRVDQASVASVVVAPRMRIPFSIEIVAADVQDFYNFVAVPASGAALGEVTLSYWFGDLQHRNSFAY